MNKYKGTFVVVEGLDGVGKSSTEKIYKHNVHQKGKNIVLTHEPFVRYPNGKPYTKGVNMYKKIQSPQFKQENLTSRDMFIQNGKEHMQKVIIPALKKGKTVVCDRGLLSSLAYQGKYKHINGKLIDTNHVLKANEKIQGKYMVKPDTNIYLHLDNRDEIDRITGRATGATHKVDKFDKALTQTKRLNSMKKKYKLAIKQMQKIGVPCKKIDAKLQPEQRADALSNIIKNIQQKKEIRSLKQQVENKYHHHNEKHPMPKQNHKSEKLEKKMNRNKVVKNEHRSVKQISKDQQKQLQHQQKRGFERD